MFTSIPSHHRHRPTARGIHSERAFETPPTGYAPESQVLNRLRGGEDWLRTFGPAVKGTVPRAAVPARNGPNHREGPRIRIQLPLAVSRANDFSIGELVAPANAADPSQRQRSIHRVAEEVGEGTLRLTCINDVGRVCGIMQTVLEYREVSPTSEGSQTKPAAPMAPQRPRRSSDWTALHPFNKGSTRFSDRLRRRQQKPGRAGSG